MWVRRRRQPRATLAQGIAAGHGRPPLVERAAPPQARTLITWTSLALLTACSGAVFLLSLVAASQCLRSGGAVGVRAGPCQSATSGSAYPEAARM